MFSFEPYHILLAFVGAGLLFSYWLPHLIWSRPPAVSAALMGFGIVGTLVFPQSFAGIDPTVTPEVWETVAEIVVIVVLYATGLRIDRIGGLRLWQPTIGLLVVAMPLTIGAVALLGWGVAGLTAAGAILLGAVLAPTDPVLAGDVQVGPPLEGREHPVRFALTTEAGLNDGLAFPFVYLALVVAAGDLSAAAWGHWVLWDALYRISLGAALGAGIGWLIGRVFFAGPARGALAEAGPGVLALAAVFLCYGLVELAEGYGFVAAFVAGVVTRRSEERHPYHQRLHQFCSALEDAKTAILLVLLGAVMPGLWPHLTWQHAVIGFGLIFVIRPLAGAVSLVGSPLTLRERGVVAFYGVRGIGSIYYLGYAATHIEFVDEARLWALVAFTIFASTVVHGLTASATVRVLIDEPDDEPGEEARHRGGPDKAPSGF